MAIIRDRESGPSRSAAEWIDQQGRFIFGKHRGELVESVISEDPSYIRWIVNEVEDITEDDRDFLAQQLKYGRR